MVKSPFHQIVLIALSVCLIFSSGCARTRQARFYTLHSMSSSESKILPESITHNLSIGIGPVRFPKYLDRPQIVTRTKYNEVNIAEFHRWAGSLEDEFSSVLADNLSVLLSTDHLYLFPWRSSIPIEYQAAMEVSRFDGGFGGNINLRTRLTIIEGKGKKVLLYKNISLSEPVKGGSYEALVAAQSRAMKHLSSEIADAIKNLACKRFQEICSD